MYGVTFGVAGNLNLGITDNICINKDFNKHEPHCARCCTKHSIYVYHSLKILVGLQEAVRLLNNTPAQINSSLIISDKRNHLLCCD